MNDSCACMCENLQFKTQFINVLLHKVSYFPSACLYHKKNVFKVKCIEVETFEKILSADRKNLDAFVQNFRKLRNPWRFVKTQGKE